ncbi:MAG TPA: HAD hydrolase-like protein [Nitrososphaerales archaeon]|nr:HAD hydrolase-like protein [Nitrososphaerales archaeon]
MARVGGRFAVFDLDGTLISLPVEWDKVRQELQKLTGTDLKFAPFFIDVQTLVADDPLLLEPIMRTIDEYEARALPGVKLEEGAESALSALSIRAKLSLVTMQGRAACDEILEKLDIERFFASSFTREDSMDRTTQLRMALESMEAKVGDSFFVGDRINDLNAARATGVRFVMIRKRPDTPPADAVFRSVSEFASSTWVQG